MTIGDTLDIPQAIVNDIYDLFSYSKEITYQERAHRYLEAYEVVRTCNDTAMHACVTDLVRRAYLAGMRGGKPISGTHELKATLLETSAMLLRCATEMEVR